MTAASSDTAIFGLTAEILPSSIQHVGLGEVSHLAVERQHHAAFEKDTVLPLQARQFGVGLRRAGALCDGAARQYFNCGFATRQADARFQKAAT
jgi:hypothetical protein